MKVTEVKKQEVVQVFFDETDFFLEIEEFDNCYYQWLRHKNTCQRLPLEGKPKKYRSLEQTIEWSVDMMYDKNTQRSMETFKKRFLDRIPYDE